MSGAPGRAEEEAPFYDGPPESVAPPPGHPRFPLFDALRAIAVFAVLLHHMGYLTQAFFNQTYGPILAHLNIGVVLFFVISGFLLFRPLIAERFGGAPAPRIRDYARRRVLRIVPGYWVALTVLAIWPGLIGLELLKDNWWEYYLLIQTWPLTEASDCADVFLFCGISQTWSLAVEASFYALLPLYAIGARALTSGRSREGSVAIHLALLAALAAASLFAYDRSFGDPALFWLGINITGTFIWFAFGIALAVLSAAYGDLRGLRLTERPELAWIAAIAVFLVVAYVVVPTDPLQIRSGTELLLERVGYGLAAFLLALPAVFGDPAQGLVRRLLAHPLIAWLGLVSFGVFLYHVTVAQKIYFDWIPDTSLSLLTLTTVAITVPIAAASYYLVEKPLLRFK